MAPAPRALPELRDLIIEELGRPAGPEAEAMAARLAARPGVAAVLFYGPRLRECSGEGPPVCDRLPDRDPAYHGCGLAAPATRPLPAMRVTVAAPHRRAVRRPAGGSTEYIDRPAPLPHQPAYHQ